MTTTKLVPPEHIADWVWTALAYAADQHTHPFHLLTMATVSPDGRPAARLMTIRGADRARRVLWFYSRTDTPKIADVRANPFACVVGYHPGAGVQVRLTGIVTVLERGPVADGHWQHVAAVSRWLFEATPEQGAEMVGIDPRLPLDRERLTAGLTARSRAVFGVLEVTVETIDWQQATGTREFRAAMHAKDHWRCSTR